MKIWNITERKVEHTFDSFSSPAYSVAVSANGRFFIGAGFNSHKWNIQEQSKEYVHLEYGSVVLAMTVSADSQS